MEPRPYGNLSHLLREYLSVLHGPERLNGIPL